MLVRLYGIFDSTFVFIFISSLLHTQDCIYRPSGAGGQGGPPLPPQSFLKICPFFEEPFKCAFFENIKSEIVNIQ